VSTHEHELITPVDLCTSDGLSLNPGARGWSRTPLHRANLVGRPGTNKRWDYWAILAGDLVVSSVYSNIDHFGLADVGWINLVSGESGGRSIVTSPDRIGLPERPGTAPLRVDQDGLDLAIVDEDSGTRLTAAWTEPDGRLGRLDVLVELPTGHESVNVVVPWSEELFNFTSKHQARPAMGTLVVGEQHWAIGGPVGAEAWGVLDVGRGRWPSTIAWNWGAGAGRCGNHVVGIQVGAKWTAGTGATENGFLVDGRLTKLGNELGWEYSWEEPMEPWYVRDPGGQLDLTLTPRYDKHSHVEAGDLGSETHQVFGTWSGLLVTDDGVRLEVVDAQGFAEEARQRW
jgi:hypothetical protein